MHSVHNHAVSIKTRRQSRLRTILQQRHPRSQDELASMLRHDGIEATQATLSRDLRELGVLKGPAGYTLPGATTGREGVRRELHEAAAAFLLSVQPAGNLVVLRTGAGQASALALELDRAGLEGIAGTVAGDDTIFIAATTSRQAIRLTKVLSELAERP
jgi:transcriptional regulator of arginine metabolism